MSTDAQDCVCIPIALDLEETSSHLTTYLPSVCFTYPTVFGIVGKDVFNSQGPLSCLMLPTFLIPLWHSGHSEGLLCFFIQVRLDFHCDQFRPPPVLILGSARRPLLKNFCFLDFSMNIRVPSSALVPSVQIRSPCPSFTSSFGRRLLRKITLQFLKSCFTSPLAPPTIVKSSWF